MLEVTQKTYSEHNTLNLEIITLENDKGLLLGKF